jgi:hypothetical protein
VRYVSRRKKDNTEITSQRTSISKDNQNAYGDRRLEMCSKYRLVEWSGRVHMLVSLLERCSVTHPGLASFPLGMAFYLYISYLGNLP